MVTSAVLAAAPAEAKIRKAQKQKQLLKGAIQSQLSSALEADIITQQEAELIEKSELARFEAISVDDFLPEELTAGEK